MRDLEQQPGAVSGLGIITGGTAVQKALEDRHAVHDNLVGGLAGEVGHHAHAAVVMFEFASVQSLRALLSIRLLDVFAVHVVFAFA